MIMLEVQCVCSSYPLSANRPIIGPCKLASDFDHDRCGSHLCRQYQGLAHEQCAHDAKDHGHEARDCAEGRLAARSIEELYTNCKSEAAEEECREGSDGVIEF